MLEDPCNELRDDAYGLTVSPELAPDTPGYVTRSFEEGWPVAIDGQKLSPVDLVTSLNELDGSHGVGRIDLLENRLVGMKSRGVYETPGGTILSHAHRELEHLVLDKLTMRQKDKLALEYAGLVYNVLWFSPLRRALDAFVDETQKVVTGEVKVTLLKGAATPVSRRSPYSLYDEALATVGADDVYKQSDIEGLVEHFGPGTLIAAMREFRARGWRRGLAMMNRQSAESLSRSPHGRPAR